MYSVIFYKRIRIFIALLLIIIGCDTTEGPRSIPEFSMVLTDTTKVFSAIDIPEDKPSMILWFDPNCRDCQEETEEILADMENFKNVNIYLITKHPYSELIVFYNHLRLDTCNNITVGIDTAATVAKAFNFRATPLTLVYNTQRILTGVFTGKVTSRQLLKIINKKS